MQKSFDFLLLFEVKTFTFIDYFEKLKDFCQNSKPNEN